MKESREEADLPLHLMNGHESGQSLISGPLAAAVWKPPVQGLMLRGAQRQQCHCSTDTVPKPSNPQITACL